MRFYYSTVKTQSIFSQMLTIDTPWLACESEILGAFCELDV